MAARDLNDAEITLRVKLAEKANVSLLCHCAEDARECHRFLLQDLIKRECGAKT
jgi:hypothetical protein